MTGEMAGGESVGGGNSDGRGTMRLARQVRAIVAVACSLSALGIGTAVTAEPSSDLAEQALSLERAGLLKDAAVVYEKIAATQPANRKVVAARLVQAYVQLKEPGKAIEWARQVMLTHPDPQAYLAGVYARVGEHRAALDILEKELAATNAPAREIALCWQAADVYEMTHQPQAAHHWLEKASEAARGQPEEQAARARLARTDAKREAKQ